MDHLEKFTFSDESNSPSGEPPAKKSSKNVDFRWKTTVKLQNAGAVLRNFTEKLQEKELHYISVCTNSFSGCDSILSLLEDENLYTNKLFLHASLVFLIIFKKNSAFHSKKCFAKECTSL